MGKKYKKSLTQKGPGLRGTHRKRIGELFAVITLCLIALLGVLCAKGSPLWLITIGLLLNIGFLVFCVLFDSPIGGNTGYYKKEIRKNRIKLLRWGLCCGLLLFGFVLLATYYNWWMPPKALVYGVCGYLGYKFRNKQFW